VSLDPLRRWEQRIGALAVPSPYVWAALVAAFLGFGVLIGRVTGSDAITSLAASRAPLKLLVARSPLPSTPTTTSAIPSPPPPAEAEATPEPSTVPKSPPKSAKTTSGAPPAPSETAQGSEESPTGKKGAHSKGTKAKPPAIKHVFVVMLSDEPYATAFGPASPAHYLTGTLEKQGQLLLRYYAVAHEGLADAIALLSGQGPTAETAANCPTYTDIAAVSTGVDGQVPGKGCVYPASTDTLMSQLTAKHLTWKGYIEGIDEGHGTPSACAHPALGAVDPSATGTAPGAQPAGSSQSLYQTWRNPFVYFSSIAGSSSCASGDVGMSALKSDLTNEKLTPDFSYIAPGPCDDGSPTPCAPGKTSGMMAADDFLRKIVPEILSSKAYKKDGLLVLTVDNAPASGEYADSSSCCAQPHFPNLPAPTGAAALSPPGGGQVGLLLLSPFVKKGGGLIQEPYDHFSLLATIEQIFGLSRLGYAALPAVKPFSASLLAGA
jgi:hypothetical protein